jgi:DNA replication protein DnaC
MLRETTVEKLYDMKLSVMAKAFGEQCKDAAFLTMAFEDRLGLMVDAEWTARKNNRLMRLIKSADYAIPGACVEDIEYNGDRNLDKAQIQRLASCAYIDERHNVIVLGATGSGKTYISNALGFAASRGFYTVKYVRLPDFLADLHIARGDGTYRRVINKYKSVSLLIFDEWLLFPLKDYEARDVLEIVEARHKRASTIFCSQFQVEGWHDKIGETTLADAIVDRIAHDSYTITIAGADSMRKRKGLKSTTDMG